VNGYNIAADIVGDRYVSTAMHPTFIAALDSYVKTYETLIWEWDGERRGKWLHEINHANEAVAAKVHGYIVSNLRKKEEAE
jgi:hypothetical protein